VVSGYRMVRVAGRQDVIGRYIQHSVDEVVQSLEPDSSSSIGHGQSGSKACKDGCESYSSE
jgi:hypothetical protein